MKLLVLISLMVFSADKPNTHHQNLLLLPMARTQINLLVSFFPTARNGREAGNAMESRNSIRSFMKIFQTSKKFRSLKINQDYEDLIFKILMPPVYFPTPTCFLVERPQEKTVMQPSLSGTTLLPTPCLRDFDKDDLTVSILKHTDQAIDISSNCLVNLPRGFKIKGACVETYDFEPHKLQVGLRRCPAGPSTCSVLKLSEYNKEVLLANAATLEYLYAIDVSLHPDSLDDFLEIAALSPRLKILSIQSERGYYPYEPFGALTVDGQVRSFLELMHARFPLIECEVQVSKNFTFGEYDTFRHDE